MPDTDREARAQAWAALCQLLHVVADDRYPPKETGIVGDDGSGYPIYLVED